MMRVIVIPALNPTEKLTNLVKELLPARIIVVNDGSGPEYASVFDAIRDDCVVLTHEHNRGKGDALKTGIRHALGVYPNATGIITADADGQHSPKDIRRIAESMSENPESVILGVRDFSQKQTPFKSRLGNRITSLAFRLKTGVNLTDTQTGLRGFPVCRAEIALSAEGSRFEYEMNLLMTLCKSGAELIALPIETIYSDNNRSTHFRAVRDSVRIYLNIIKFKQKTLDF